MLSPIQSVLSSFLQNVLLFGGALMLCFLTSWRLAVLAITSISPIVQITRAYAQWSSFINKDIWAALGKASQASNQALSNIRTVKAFGAELMEIEKYQVSTGTALAKSVLDSCVSAGTYALTSWFDLGTSVLILWYGGNLVLNGQDLSLGQLIKFQLFWNMVNRCGEFCLRCSFLCLFLHHLQPVFSFFVNPSSSYNSIASLINQFTRASAAAQRVFSLMDSLPDIDPHAGRVLTRTDVRGGFTLENVDFHYQMRPENKVMMNLSLSIKPGSVCALVGPSGTRYLENATVPFQALFFSIRSCLLNRDANLSSLFPLPSHSVSFKITHNQAAASLRS